MATEHLQALTCAVKSLVGESRFDDGGDQTAPALRGFAARGIGVVFGDVELQRSAVGDQATPIDPGALGVENAAHGRVL